MSCYGCGSSFSTFKKEHGCKNCGYAFCMNCMPNKLPILKLKNEKHRVCMKCYNIITGKVKPKKEDPAKYSPPENFKKRMAALEERESKVQGHTGPKDGGGHHKVYTGGMPPADVEIQQRLEQLKEKTPQEVAAGKVTTSEIEDRLARMKGTDPTKFSSGNKPVYHPPDRRTQQEQMNDLLDEISNEVELDSRLPDPVTEIATRLAHLKYGTIECNTTADDNENNLNKPSLRDSAQFSHNISTVSSQQWPGPKLDTKTSKDGEGLTMEQKPSNSDHEDAVSPEEVSRMLIEAAKELEDDALNAMRGLQQDKEIMKKIQEIKQRRKESATDINKDEDSDKSDSDNEDDDKIADDIILQALEESKLDEAAAKDGVKTNSTDVTNAHTKKMNTDGNDEWNDPDELPYCCICTADAKVRCMDCDRDLYCSECFSDGHKELGLSDHVSIKYFPPKLETEIT